MKLFNWLFGRKAKGSRGARFAGSEAEEILQTKAAIASVAKGNGPVPGSNFQYSGWTTECNHLGNVAYRTGKTLEWDYAAMRAPNAPASAPFIKRPSYRAGWENILKT